MSREELEIIIEKDGSTRVEVKGRPGRRCLDYRDLIRDVLAGEVTGEEYTEEMYMAEEEERVRQKGRDGT